MFGFSSSRRSDKCHITLNKNCVPGDRSAASPGGVRIGAPALTTRGFVESDFEQIGAFLDRVVQISTKIQSTSGKKLVDFVNSLNGNPEIDALAADVQAFAKRFPMPGFDVATLKYGSA